MRKVFGIIAIIIFVVILDFMTERYTNNTVNEITEKLTILNEKVDKYIDNSKFYMDNKNLEEIIKISNELLENWREKDNVLSFYIEHDELEKISNKINSFNKQVETSNYNDAIVSLIETEFLLNHITQKQNLSLKNIF